MFFLGERRRANSKARSFIFIKTNRGARASLANQRKKKAKETAAQRNMGACDGATQNSFHHLLFADKFFPGAHLLTRRRAEWHFFCCSSAAAQIFQKSVSPLLAGVLKARAHSLFPAATENNYFATRERSEVGGSHQPRAQSSRFLLHPQPLLIAKKSTFALCWRARRRI